MKNQWPAKVLSFAGVGAVSTLLQYLILVLCVEVFGISAVAGSSIGFACSAVFNYLLNYHFTFQSDHSHLVAASRFAVVASVGLAINTGLMALFMHYSALPYVVAQVITTLVVLVWNFLGNAWWTFGLSKGHT